MIKRLFNALLLSFLLVSCSSQLPELKYGGLSGDVASVKTSTYTAGVKSILRDDSSLTGTLLSIAITEYDAGGHLIKETTFDADEKQQKVIVYGYDKNNLNSIITMDGDGNVIKEEKLLDIKNGHYLWEIKENGKANRITKVYNKSKKALATFRNDVITEVIIYDGNSRPVAVVNGEETDSRVSYEYDWRGNRIKTSIEQNGFTDYFKYEYLAFDEHDNWTRCKFTYDNHLQYFDLREITYR